MSKVASLFKRNFLTLLVGLIFIFLSNYGDHPIRSQVTNPSASPSSGASSLASQKLPQETLRALEESARKYKELRQEVGAELPDMEAMRSYCLEHPQSTRALASSASDNLLVLPPGGPMYTYNGIPFSLGGLPDVLAPVLWAYHGRQSQSLPLPGLTATKAHFLLWSGWSYNVPTGQYVGNIRMYYKDGSTTTKELIQGVNVAEWCYDRPDVIPMMRHTSIPAAYSWSQAWGSGSFMVHIFYVEMDLEEKEADHIELSVIPQNYSPYTGWYGIWISSMTLELTGNIQLEDSGYHPAHPTVGSLGGPLPASDQELPVNCNEPLCSTDLETGNNLVAATDVSHDSLGPSFAFTRAYSSQWSYSGPLGYGWTHSYNTTLKEQTDGSLMETDELGTVYFYSKKADGTYTSPPGRNALVVKNTDGTYTLTESSQLKKKFGADSALLSLTDVNNNAMILAYESGKLTKITDAAGRIATLSYYPDGKLSKVVDPAQRKVEYFYENDNLVRVNDVLGLDTSYTYTTDHKLTKITSFDNKNYSFVYNDQGKLVSKTNYAGDAVGVSYDPTARTSVVTDAKGNATTYTTDERGRTTSKIDPYGAETRYEWDENNNITKITDRRGGVQELTYDTRGNVLTHKNQLGKTTTFTYNDKNQVTSIKDALDKTVQFVYDPKGNLLKVIDPRGTVVLSCTYNSRGERTSISDAFGHTYHYEFDLYGNVVEERDPYDKKTLRTYDIVDRLTSTTNAKGKTTSFTYGLKDELVKIAYPDQTKTRFDWYPCCQILKSVVDAKLNGTTYFYDEKRRLIKVVDAANGQINLEYDKNDNRTAIIDPKTNRTELSYDKSNRLSRIDYPDGTSESFTYYPDGLLKTKTDGNGATISFEYDPVGKLIKKCYPDGSHQDLSHDAVGNRTSMTDSTGTYTYSRDDLYRLTGVTLPSGKSIGYSYDIQGLRAEMTDYDHKKYVYKYDKMNRLQSLILPGNEKIGYEYDVLSNLTKVSYPNNTYSAYAFNDMNRLTKISTMKKGFREKLISEFAYSYDEVGNRVSMEERQIFGKPLETLYSFDSLYRLATVSYPNHVDEAYTYDLSGNRTLCETKKMKYVSCFVGWKWDEKACKKFVHYIFHPEYVTYIVKYQYDKANKLMELKEAKKIHDKELLEKTVAYEFDRNGNQVKESILNQGCRKPVVNDFGYDYENHLTSAVMKGIKQYGFSYDGEGRRIRTTVGSVERGGHGNLSRCGHPGESAQVTQHLYDGSSMIMDLDSRGKVVSSYAYGMGLNAINSPAVKGYYHSDALGSITEITGKEGQAIRSYRYDAWGAFTTGENAHDSNPFRYVGAYGVRWQDSTLGLYHMQARFYKPRTGRFNSPDPLRTLNPYNYCQDNPIRYIDPSGYDAIGDAAAAGAAAGAEAVIRVGWDYEGRNEGNIQYGLQDFKYSSDTGGLQITIRVSTDSSAPTITASIKLKAQIIFPMYIIATPSGEKFTNTAIIKPNGSANLTDATDFDINRLQKVREKTDYSWSATTYLTITGPGGIKKTNAYRCWGTVTMPGRW